MQERRAGSRPALRPPWQVAMCQLIKPSLTVPSSCSETPAVAQLGRKVPKSPLSLSQDLLLRALWGGGGGRTASPSRCVHAVTEPVLLLCACMHKGSDGVWSLQQTRGNCHQLLGALWLLAVSHLSSQGGKCGKVIHPILAGQLESHRATS